MTGAGHVAVDRLLDGPAALARVGDPALEVLEVLAVGLERAARQLEQPRADDGAVHPELGDRREVELVVARVQDLEALGVGLHHAVLDAVVDHLHVVAGARAADVEVAALRREGREDRLERRRPRSRSPPTIRQKPTCRPQIPPDVPAST